ncbi:AraC family transcriptional regulator [Chryseobacterium daecheongense]|uniref:Helix-turn-helix domain-containing protein n=1 Tax=Chryseobacterium daecheongense TaxID=192389 RepID=A0A3N0VYU7_9FLAO|nr:AraC family transcriptional regulator [Chryseobacterium daecheongense]ROH97690.1 helix-turn-helix domain-containing protein [Chryseobacterium daecheongense]TDX93149.1 YesN/AraC family two-component response regulator [Chryseobacterium daecheongense]
MKKIYFVFFLSLFISISAQDPHAYNKIYTKTYLETAQKDFNKAIQIADSLFTISETPYYKAKSLMLTASLYQQSGDIEKSVNYALRSEQIVEGTEDDVWKAKIYGFLATQYRFLKLYKQSKSYSFKTLHITKEIENPELRNNILGLVMQEMAYCEMEQQRFQKSIHYIQKSQKYFNATKQDLNFFSSNNEQLLGLNYYHLKDFDKALSHYNKAIGFCKNIPENHVTGLIYNGFAQVYIEKGDWSKAKKYIDSAQSISDKSEYLQLKNEVYSTVKKYYTAKEDMKNLTRVQQKQDSVVSKIQKKSSDFINKSYDQLEEKNTEISERSSIKDIIIVVCSMMMAGGVVGFVIYTKNRQKKTIRRFREIIAQINTQKITNKAEPLQEENREEEQEKAIDSEFSMVMTTATELKILQQLEEFEKSYLFTNNNISLSSLSSSFGTNTKYLSHVINTHKKKDFNNYINDLRVYYVVKKLKDNYQYRKYKIAVLAEEAGFSSQNKFATVFKKTTSMSPSLFIKHLQTELSEKV